MNDDVMMGINKRVLFYDTSEERASIVNFTQVYALVILLHRVSHEIFL